MSEEARGLLHRSRLAGWYYLAFMATLILASTLRGGLIVHGDAAETARRILEAPRLFSFIFVCDAVSGLFFLLAAWALHALLRPVGKDLALLFLLLNAVGVAIQCLSLLSHFAAAFPLIDPAISAAFPEEQARGLALLALRTYESGFMLAQLFYGAWLLPLGFLVYKSGFLPKALGILLMLDCLGVVFWFLQFFLLPDHKSLSIPGLAVSFLAEASLTLWLIVRGARRKPGVLREVGPP